jgi:hypothetical protein
MNYLSKISRIELSDMQWQESEEATRSSSIGVVTGKASNDVNSPAVQDIVQVSCLSTHNF